MPFCIPGLIEFMVAVRPYCILLGGATDEVIVCERPGGGAAPKMFEKAASRLLFGGAP
jgi:hypothetical protein